MTDQNISNPKNFMGSGESPKSCANIPSLYIRSFNLRASSAPACPIVDNVSVGIATHESSIDGNNK